MAPEMDFHHGGADFVAPEKELDSGTVDTSVEKDAAKTSEEAEKDRPSQRENVLPEQQRSEQQHTERRTTPPFEQPATQP